MSDMAMSRHLRSALIVFFAALVVFLYAPILVLVIFSFNNSTSLTFPLSGFTMHWYKVFISNPSLVAALRASAEVAALSSLVTVMLGLLASIALVRRKIPAKTVISALLISPLVIPLVVLGISLLILFRQMGVSLSLLTVAVGHVVLSLPFAVLILTPRIEQLDPALEEVARDLYAGNFAVFRLVTVPLVFPAVAAAFLMAFTLSFDEFAVASFLVGTQVTFPVYLFSQLRFPQLLPQVIAVAVIVMTVSLVLVISAETSRYVTEWRRKRQLRRFDLEDAEQKMTSHSR
jgi:spermidine/putrescine transport system permease protein